MEAQASNFGTSLKVSFDGCRQKKQKSSLTPSLGIRSLFNHKFKLTREKWHANVA